MIIQNRPAEREFSDNLGEILIFNAATVKLEVAIDGWKTIFSQSLMGYDYGDGHIVEFNLGELIEPYSKEFSSFPLVIKIKNGDIEETINTWVFHHDGDIEDAFDEFCGNHFLTNATSRRTTLQRKESLYFPYGGELMRNAGASLRVYYDDNTITDYPLTVNTATTQNIRYLSFKGSDYVQEGKTIYRMVAILTTEVLDANHEVKETRYATMEYLIDFEHEAEEGPVFIYENAFGVPEKFYATGNVEADANIERDSAVINGVYKNYRQRMVRQWKVDSGILSPEEAEVLLEMFRSPHIMQCKIDKWGEYSEWKEVAIIKSDQKYTDDDDSQPRYTFTYRNAERHVSAQSSKNYPYIFGEEHSVMFE